MTPNHFLEQLTINNSNPKHEREMGLLYVGQLQLQKNV